MNKSMAKTGEIRSLTGLRGIAACLIMIFHLSHGQIQNSFAYRFVDHGYLAVDMFLILSGFVLGITYVSRLERGQINFFDFLSYRVMRIWPLYVALTFVYAAIMLARGVAFDAWFGFTLFANATMIDAWALSPPIIGPGWSISAEWAACLLFPVLGSVAIASSWRVTAATFAVASATLIGVSALPWQWVGTNPKIDLLDVHDWTTLAPVVRCLADFVFGLIAFKIFAYAPRTTAIMGRDLFGIVIAGAILVCMFLHGTDLLLVLLFFALILHLSSDRGPVARGLQWRPIYNLGLWSYAIYLVHYRTESVWFMLSDRLSTYLQSYAHAGATAIIGALSISVAIPLHMFFEKPAQRYLRAWYDGIRNVAGRSDRRRGSNPTPAD